MCSVQYQNIEVFQRQQVQGLLRNFTGVKIPILSDLPLINTLF